MNQGTQWPLEDKKGKETESLLEPPEENTGLLTAGLETTAPMSDAWPT